MTLRPLRLALPMMAAALLCAGPSRAAAPAQAASGNDVVAREGSTAVTASDVDAMLADLDPTTRQRVLASTGGLIELVRSRLATKALLAEANGKNWAARPDIAQAIQRSRDNVIEQSYLASVSQPDPAYPTDAELQTAYDANRAQFNVPRQLHLSEVLIPGAASSPPKKPPASLYASGTPNDLGLIPENRLAPNIRDAIANVAVGGTSAPVHLQDGWHVIRVVAIKPAGVATLAEVKPQLTDALRRQREQDKARAYLATLQNNQHLQINEIALASMVRK